MKQLTNTCEDFIYIFPFQIISQNLQWKEHGMGSKKDFKIKWKNSSISCRILGEWFGRQVTATDNYKSLKKCHHVLMSKTETHLFP